MKTWTKEEALATLKELAEGADKLRNLRAFSTEHTMWVTRCLDTLEEVFGEASRYYLSFVDIKWGQIPPGTIIETWILEDKQAAIDAKSHHYFLLQLGTAKGFLLGALGSLKDREITDVCTKRESGIEASLVLSVLNLAEQKLRKVIREKPEREKQVQDAFENLLIGADITFGREVDSVEYSSKTYTPDFSLRKIGLAVEIKLCNRSEREKELPEEINDDILAYQTKYQNLLFIIYDLGYIRDIDRFCGSFEQHENVTITGCPKSPVRSSWWWDIGGIMWVKEASPGGKDG